ncbi:MAG: CAP domain-containing protein [Anaerolineae bacterium]|nr:CAP domain-containing protein [Anaerolineae bacterium]
MHKKLAILVALMLWLGACDELEVWTVAPTATPSALSLPTWSLPAATLPADADQQEPDRDDPAWQEPGAELEAEVIALINQARSKRGLEALVADSHLTAAARAHSLDMAQHDALSHTGSDGSTPAERIARQGYAWMLYAENVSCGYTTPAEVVQGWMDSKGHRDNILLADLRHIGVGTVYRQDRSCVTYWTAVFARPAK